MKWNLGHLSFGRDNEMARLWSDIKELEDIVIKMEDRLEVTEALLKGALKLDKGIVTYLDADISIDDEGEFVLSKPKAKGVKKCCSTKKEKKK